MPNLIGQSGRRYQRAEYEAPHIDIQTRVSLRANNLRTSAKMYQTRQAYAPTPHSYIPNTTLSATINLDEVNIRSKHTNHKSDALRQEVKLAESRAERDLQDSLAEVFSIIITLDEIEKAYLKDAIVETDYTEICDRLLKQYKAILADEAVSREFVDLETFKNAWDVCITCSSHL